MAILLVLALLLSNCTSKEGSRDGGSETRSLTLLAINDIGPDAISLRSIARVIGVSHAAPAKHFPSKADLFAAIALEGHQLLDADFERHNPPTALRLQPGERRPLQVAQLERRADQRLLAGWICRGSEDAVMEAAENAGTERARMYAHLYLGLFHEVAGDEKKARDHLQEAAAARLENHYMHDVAKVHLLQRKWKAEAKP